MEYIAYGAVITNRLLYTDGTCIADIMGGSGLYSFSALRMCTPNAMLLAGIGTDFDTYYGSWLDFNNCVRSGLKENMEKTAYNELVYASDGSYVEYSIYGPEQEKVANEKMVLPGRDLLPFLSDAKGVCINVAMDAELSQILLTAKKSHPFQVMWEVPASAISGLGAIFASGGIPALKQQLAAIDIFSTNKPESFAIFGVNTISEAIAHFQKLDMPVYYRVGTKGAYMICGQEIVYVPMISLVSREQEIDPTGCGNSSTAAAMWGYCETGDILKSCIIGNVMAAYNVQQYGPYPNLTEQTHQEMMAHVERIYQEQKRNPNKI